VARPSTTTTTSLPTCGGNTSAPTFASVDCQIDALLARLAAEPLLASFASKLTQSVQTGKARKVDAESTCRASNLKKTKKQLQQAAKAFTQYVHRLNGLRARKKLNPNLRQSFLADGTGIQQALGTLRNAVRCPDDAPPG
jgi:hypothetical protein